MTESPFKPPLVLGIESQEYVLVFVLEGLGAGLQNTVVTSMIPLKYAVTKIETFFSDDAINNVRVYWLMSNNAQGSTTSIPDGSNLIAPFSAINFIIGHADLVSISANVLSETDKSYIKMHVINNNAYAVDIMGLVTIRKV